MAIPAFILDRKGKWSGTTQLNQSWLPPEEQISESESELLVEPDATGAYARLSYTWSYEGKPHTGAILLCGGETEFQLAWVDSWHQNAGVMHLTGGEHGSASFKTTGYYEVEGKRWGWTIAFSVEGDSLLLEMENVDPDGPAEWAVRAKYARA